MKNLAYITMIAALILGSQSTWATTATIVNDLEGPTTAALPTGRVIAEFNEEEQMLYIDLFTAGDRERVTLQLANSRGQIVTTEVIIADGRGTNFKINMRGERAGTYTLKVSSNSIRHSEKLSTK